MKGVPCSDDDACTADDRCDGLGECKSGEVIERCGVETCADKARSRADEATAEYEACKLSEEAVICTFPEGVYEETLYAFTESCKRACGGSETPVQCQATCENDYVFLACEDRSQLAGDAAYATCMALKGDIATCTNVAIDAFKKAYSEIGCTAQTCSYCDPSPAKCNQICTPVEWQAPAAK